MTQNTWFLISFYVTKKEEEIKIFNFKERFSFLFQTKEDNK